MSDGAVVFSKWAQSVATAAGDIRVVAGGAVVHRLLMCHHLVCSELTPVVVMTADEAAAQHTACTQCPCDSEWTFEGPVALTATTRHRFSRPPFVLVSFGNDADADAVDGCVMHSDRECEALRGPNVPADMFVEVHLLDMVNHMCMFDWPAPCVLCFDASLPENAAVLEERVSNPACRRFPNQRAHVVLRIPVP